MTKPLTQSKSPSSPKVPVHRPGLRRPAPASASQVVSAKPATSSKVRATQASKSVSPQPPMAEAIPERPRSYVAERAAGLAAEIQIRTAFFETINQVKALTLISSNPAPALSGSLAQIRGYAREDLFAIAEIGYHYLMNGASKLAVTLFEGLAAVSPDEPYFAMGAGLAHDHEGDRASAISWYNRAAELDPADARADLNRAELYIEQKDKKSARRLLSSALEKARRRGDEALSKKASAMLNHLSRAA